MIGMCQTALTGAFWHQLRTSTDSAGQGRWQEGIPLLSQSQDALKSDFGEEYEALGEAEFYLALAQVVEATEVNLADLNESLIQVPRLNLASLCYLDAFAPISLLLSLA